MTQSNLNQALNDLNEEANNRFEQIRNRLGMNFGLSQHDLKVPIREFKDAQIHATIETYKDKSKNDAQVEDLIKISEDTIQAREYIDGVFSFINSLNLSPNLACALGYIISYKKTNNIAELEMAIDSMEKEINK